ncbi:hypothetical protein CB1_001437005 [Camelus ferus]|nr:hypothetical protein CB1_001437005 [Camelus ferus]
MDGSVGSVAEDGMGWCPASLGGTIYQFKRKECGAQRPRAFAVTADVWTSCLRARTCEGSRPLLLSVAGSKKGRSHLPLKVRSSRLSLMRAPGTPTTRVTCCCSVSSAMFQTLRPFQQSVFSRAAHRSERVNKSLVDSAPAGLHANRTSVSSSSQGGGASSTVMPGWSSVLALLGDSHRDSHRAFPYLA